MERGVTLSSDKGGLARVVSAPKEANTRYIRPILRRLLPFPSSSSFLFPFVSFRLTPHAAFLSPLEISFCLLVASWSRLWGAVARSKSASWWWRGIVRKESKQSKDISRIQWNNKFHSLQNFYRSKYSRLQFEIASIFVQEARIFSNSCVSILKKDSFAS